MSERSRTLTKDEVEALPENRSWPPGAEVVYSNASGTWEGHGYDNLMMSASLDRYFVGPYRLEEVVEWYERHLASLGWPPGTPNHSAHGTAWHQWRWNLESIDLIDRVIGPEHPLAQTPAKWRGPRLASELPPDTWMWSVTYERQTPPDAERPAAMTPPSEEETFDARFGLLQRFVERQGHADVPFKHVEDGLNLGVWVSNLRFEQANMGLRADWASRLAALPGWKWLSGSDFFLLERYVKRTGTSQIPKDFFDEGRPLGEWVAQVRRMHAKGELAPETRDRLERIPGWEW